jgi:cellulose synthase/poly-beta-1,6-N-acetylglucosamine synthase-like glycosyltransferase
MLLTAAILASAVIIYVVALEWITAKWRTTSEFQLPVSASEQRITVVVALKNEQHNVKELIESLKRQNYNNLEIILANDHSSDQTADIICSEIGDDSRFKIFTPGGNGKKNAIKEAVDKASGKIIITTDADCNFGENWVSTTASYHTIQSPSLLTAPVKMSSSNKLSHLFELEFLALQMVTAGAALRNNPVMCNGANMSFVKNEYQQANIRNEYASGDDMFLLTHMTQHGKKTGYLNSRNAVVTTKAPSTVREYLRQRSRWLRKATGYTQPSIVITALMVLLANMSWPILMAVSLFSDQYFLIPITIFLFIAKYMADFRILKSGEDFFGIKVKYSSVMVLEILYPVMITMITISTIGRNKRKW